MAARSIAKRALVAGGLFPTRYAWPNPFKIIEYEEVLRGVSIHREHVILDFGCGAAQQDFLLARRAKHVVGVDISEEQIKRAKRLAREYDAESRVRFYCAPLDRLPLNEGQFDKVVSFCVLEHVADYEDALLNLFRVLKKGGELLMSVDSLATIHDEELRARHAAEHDVRRYFYGPEIEESLHTIGFEGIVMRPIFRSPYAERIFGDAILGGFHFHRWRKFGGYLKLRAWDWLHRKRPRGLFLCIRATKLRF